MKTKIVIELEIEETTPGDAYRAVNNALDNGTLQDEINEPGVVEVLSVWSQIDNENTNDPSAARSRKQ